MDGCSVDEVEVEALGNVRFEELKEDERTLPLGGRREETGGGGGKLILLGWKRERECEREVKYVREREIECV